MKRAAELQGRSLTDFVVSAAHDAAQRAIEEQAILRLSAEDQQRFAEALIQPPAPNAALIGWMGRDLAFRGAGLGSMLLYDAISRVAKAPIEAYAICADAINEDATAFYQKHQFQPLVSRAQTLFLPMKTAQDLG